MDGYLRQSTPATLKLGPFVDSTDGFTAKTALTIARANVRVSKNGGAFAQKTETTTCTHDENGYYGCPIDATDTNTLGRMRVTSIMSTALPVFHTFLVRSAFWYDTEVAGLRFVGEVTSGSGTALIIPATVAFDIDEFAGRHVTIPYGALRGQTRRIVSNTASGGTHTLTLNAAFNGTVDATCGYKIF